MPDGVRRTGPATTPSPANAAVSGPTSPAAPAAPDAATLAAAAPTTTAAAGGHPAWSAEELLRLLAEHANDAVLMVTPDGIVRWASRETTRILGLVAGGDIWSAWRDLVHPDDIATFADVGDRLTRGEVVIATVRMRTITSGFRWFRISLRPLPAEGTRYAALVAGLQAVHELEETRARLTRSSEWLRLAMRASAIGIATVDNDGRFIDVNPALCTMLGRDEAALRGMRWQAVTHPDDLAADETIRAELLAGSRDAARFRKRYLRPDGRVVWADVAVAGMRHPDGSVRAFITQMVDVTVEHEIQERAERQARELAEAQRLAHVGSWTMDLRTGSRTWSDELYRIAGRDPSMSLADRALMEAAMDDPSRPLFRAAMERLMTDGTAWSLEHELRRPDGAIRSVVSTGEAIRDEAGAIVGLRGTVIDITERRRARDVRTRRLEHQLDHVARVEHTMRTRIAVVNGWAEILADRDDPSGPPAIRDGLDAILRNGRELESLLTGMLDAARATSRADSVELERVALAEVVEPIVRDYAAIHDGVRLGSSVGPDIAVIGFREGVDTILRHLVENSLRHGGEGVMVEIGARLLPDGRVEVTVLDDGPGFPAGEDVFAAFGRRSGGPGHGLGLHVVRTLTEAMGGEVEARNGPSGRGAEVVIRLEAATQD